MSVHKRRLATLCWSLVRSRRRSIAPGTASILVALATFMVSLILAVVFTAIVDASSVLPLRSQGPTLVSPGPDPAGVGSPAVPQGSDVVTSTVLLPLVVRHFTDRPACAYGSPFSLQISALHQIIPVTSTLSSSALPIASSDRSDGTTAFSSLTKALQASGACWARTRIEWAAIQPEPPPALYVWGPYHDDGLAQLAATGVQIIATVDSSPYWAAEDACGPLRGDRLDEFAQFLSDMVYRYQQPPWNIHHWELFNEPDGTWISLGEQGIGCWGHDGARYAQMLQVANAAIKSADPGATVLMGGVAQDWFVEYGGPFSRYFTDIVLTNGGADYLDVTNFHYFRDWHTEWERWDPNSEDRQNGWLPAPTCGDLFDGQGLSYDVRGPDILAKATHFRNRLSTCFGVEKPVWVTELAEHGYEGDPQSLANQALYVIQGHVRGLAAGVANITWFSLLSPAEDPFDQGLLFKGDLSPKPAYFAYQTLTKELAGYSYSRTLDQPGREAYLFEGLGLPEKTVAWSTDLSAPASLILESTTQVRLVDRWGAVHFVHDGQQDDLDGALNGSVQIALTSEPLFLTASNPALVTY